MPERTKNWNLIKPYKPIDCDYVDYIEHLATLRELVSIKYLDGATHKLVEKDLIITWKNEGEAEYLYTKSGLKVRLDHIVSINGKGLGKSCEL